MNARVPAWLPAWHRFGLRHPGVLLSGCALFVLGALALHAHTQTEQDMAALLPGGPGSPREAAQLLSEFGALNTLLLDLEVPGGDRDALVARGEALTLRLKASGRFSDIYTGPSFAELRKLGDVLEPHRLYLLPNPARTIEAALTPESLKRTLDAVKVRLAAPQALVMKQGLLRDPLDLDAPLFARFLDMAGDVAPYRGQLLSRDSHHLLLVTTPAKAALDTEASAELLRFLQRASQELEPGPAGPVVLRAVGGPRFAAESAQAVKRDVVITFVLSALLLTLLFFTRFRSLRLLVIASVPLGLGVCGGLAAVILVTGHIHALTFGFGAVLIGVGIDYQLYLLNAATAEEGTALERIERALHKTGRAIFWGFVTTFLGFGTLMLSKFPGLRELALFAGAGVGTAFVAAMLVMPPLVARFGPAQWRPVPRWIQRMKARPLPAPLAWGVMLGLLAVSVALIPRLRFDGELRHLDAQRPEVTAEFDAVVARFGMQSADALLVSRGGTKEEALQRNDAVAERLQSAERRGEIHSVRGIGAFLPTVETQRARAKTLDTLDLPRAKERLTHAALEAGFTEHAFDSFWNEVEAARTGSIQPLTEADFAGTSLATLANRLLRCGANGCIAVTSFTPRDTAASLQLGASLPAGSVLLEGGALAANIISQLPRQLALLSGVGLLVSMLVLALAYRSLPLAVLSCLPCTLGLLGTLAVFAAAGIPLNLVSGSALVLVLGCGVDYGIFVLQESSSGHAAGGTESMGVLLASFSTLSGFGTLVLAAHRALHSLGAAVGLGVLASALGAIFLVPGLHAGLVRLGWMSGERKSAP